MVAPTRTLLCGRTLLFDEMKAFMVILLLTGLHKCSSLICTAQLIISS